ncbi:c-type cytochrome biogenesis protein CcmI [Ferrovibrio sp.]|uniref:c-type cytochrome biogenesis protein CcmI n=1 Tax=Ferrovibrio sp. TaxID=1917215 RepID=UPI000CC3E6D2|nr:c-type cytochrome biogenesis protein CcmI [Ferrovibrio sp.]PJI38907.1 MAG: c-type cytochrome biogenesis protein CcmI [Ferrovibrio sp.]
MIWLGFIVLALATLGFLLWPLLRAQRQAADRKAHDIAVYRAQLAEIDEELARGSLTEAEAGAAKLEIQRRLLRADATAEGGGATASQRSVVTGAIAILLLVPMLGGGIYLAIGRPEATQVDVAALQQRAAREAKLHAETERMIAQLRERLAAEPDRADGWLLLGRSLLTLDRADEAVPALDRFIALRPQEADGYALRAEAQTLAADGSVTPQAQRDFRTVLERDPQHPGARYYLGLARLQEGDTRGAYDDWHALAADSPADAPWLDVVQARLRELAPRLGIALAQAVPEPKPAIDTAPASASGPSREQMDAAQQMSAEDRNAMVRSMVERLAERLQENPDDADGWLRLARAREVLGEAEAAREALRRAVGVAPQRIDVRLALAFNLAGTAVTSRDPLPAEAAVEFGKVLDQAPDHPQALWFVGRSAYESGNTAAAATAWNRLLAQLPPESAEAKELTQRLAGLPR